MALINREQRSRVHGTRPALVPRTAKRHAPETRDLRSLKEVGKQRAVTLPIDRTAAEAEQKLTPSHSWSSTRDYWPKAGGMIRNPD